MNRTRKAASNAVIHNQICDRRIFVSPHALQSSSFKGMAMQDYGLGLRVGLKDLPTSGACA